MPEEKTSFFENYKDVLIVVVLSGLVLAIYWQTFGFGFISLDDKQYIYENSAVLSGLNRESVKWAFTTVYQANWHPLTWISHFVDITFFGLNSGAHHAVNTLFHLVNSVLAFYVFQRMTGNFWRSAIIAALFAVHPAHVESVAWVAERKDVLSTMFWLLTMFAYIGYAHKEDKSDVDVGGEEIRKAGLNNVLAGYVSPAYLFVVLLFALGLMSKPMLVTLPFVLVLIDLWPLGRLRKFADLPHLLAEKAPLFVLSAISSYITIIAQRSGGAVESLDNLPLDVRGANALVSYAKYLVTLFYPANLALMYPYDRNFPIWQIAGSVVLLAGVTAFCIWQARERKYLLMGWLWFLGTLVPVIGILQVGSQPMADRYTYIPYFGLFVMVVWGIGDIFDHLKINRSIFVPVFAIVVIVLSFLSFRQASYWRDKETVYRHALAVTSGNAIILHELCYTLMEEKRLDEAETFCRSAIEFKPEFLLSYNTLGIIQIQRGQYAEAEQNFRKILTDHPNFSLGYGNLAVALAFEKRPEEAEDALERAVQLDNGSVQKDVWINSLNAVAAAYVDKGNFEKASENLLRILKLDNNNANARMNLSSVYYHMNRLSEAQAMMESAIQLDPNQAAAYNTYGLIMLAQGRKTEAAGLFKKALQLAPDLEQAKENLKKLETK